MEKVKKLGLIGRNISYSFSQIFFQNKFRKLNLNEYSYSIFDIKNIEEITEILSKKNILGLNVTIPYKEQIIPFLDILSPEANEVGAVNTIKFAENKKIGFNTDVFGFNETLNKHISNEHNKALILGNGGASKAIQYVFNQRKIPFEIVSRKGELTFNNLDKKHIKESKIIVQCTPVGTFPNNNDCLLFPFDHLTPNHLVIDLIYNPPITQFLKESSKHGAKIVNGQYMLEQQAEKSWEIWTSKN